MLSAYKQRAADNSSTRSHWREKLALLALTSLGLWIGASSPLLAQVNPADTDSLPSSGMSVAGYSVAPGSAEQVAQDLQARFSNRNDVRIVPDLRTHRVLVQAPPDVQQILQTEFTRPATPPSFQTTSEATTTLNWSGRDRTEQSGQLKHISWRQLISAAQGLSADRLTLTPAADGSDLVATLPSRQGPAQLRIDTTTGDFRVEGPTAAADAWLRAIRSLDKQGVTETTQLVPLGDVSPQSVDRAVQLLQSSPRTAPSPAPRWGADVVGIAATPRGRSADQLAQAEAPPPAVAPADANPPAEPNAAGDQAVGVDGSLIGQVQIEYVEGLDAIIIRGRKADVDRVMRIIDDIERLSLDTEPAIELIPLEHVNSQSMAELVTQLNAQALAVRLGTVSITPLIKPNALLLIGRRESVDSILDLIHRLDQPVAPTSQFSIFRLRHLPATDAVTTINSFFTERGGLGPRIKLEADYRTNSIIVYASPRDMEEIRQLLQEIDVADNAASSEVRVFKLNNALAEELAPVLQSTLRGEAPAAQQATGAAGTTTSTSSSRSSTLTMTRIDAQGKQILKSGILTEVRVAADVRANSLVITAPTESMELIAALVRQLDELPTSEAEIKVFTIVNGDALTLTEMLDELFGSQQDSQQGPAASATGAGESSLVPLRFSTDPRTNSIIATGASADLGVVEAILLRLDEDDVSQRKSRVYRLQNAPALDVATAINEFLRTERQITVELNPESVSPFEQIEREVVVVPEIVSNSLIISATPRYFEQIVQVVEELDKQPPMVLIQVLIASVRLNNLCELGVELGLQDSMLFDRSVVNNGALSPGFNFNNQPLGNSNSAKSLLTREKTAGQALSSFNVGRTNSNLGYGGLVLSASSESVNILLRALQQTDRLDVLSRPQVMTLNNQPAFVQVGQQVPIVQSTSQTTFGQINNVNLVNVGILLGVTPRISPDGLVVMEIDAVKSELSNEVVPLSFTDAGVLEQPIIDTTRAQTTVSARSGQTVILGGLITKSRITSTSSVPYLGDIPVIGNLFRFDSASEERSELLIIMTPYIVEKAEDANEINQIEAQRMSWCLADVVDVHGDVDFISGGVGPGPSPTQVIYPDRNPTVAEPLPEFNESMQQAPLPQPADGLPLNSHSLPAEWDAADATAGSARSETDEGRSQQSMLTRFRQRLRGKASSEPTRDVVDVANDQRDRAAVSRVQYLKSQAEPDASTTDRRRLPTPE